MLEFEKIFILTIIVIFFLPKMDTILKKPEKRKFRHLFTFLKKKIEHIAKGRRLSHDYDTSSNEIMF